MFKKGAFKEGDVVVFTEGHKKNVINTQEDWHGWYVNALDFTFVVKDTAGNFVTIDFGTEKDVQVWGGFLQLLKDGKAASSEINAQLQHENWQLVKTIDLLKQRLIKAERDALYWTVFDCPMNRDIAERILRKEG